MTSFYIKGTRNCRKASTSEIRQMNLQDKSISSGSLDWFWLPTLLDMRLSRHKSLEMVSSTGVIGSSESVSLDNISIRALSISHDVARVAALPVSPLFTGARLLLGCASRGSTPKASSYAACKVMFRWLHGRPRSSNLERKLCWNQINVGPTELCQQLGVHGLPQAKIYPCSKEGVVAAINCLFHLVPSQTALHNIGDICSKLPEK